MHGSAENFKFLKSLSNDFKNDWIRLLLSPISLFFWKLCKIHIFWVFNLSLLIYNFFFF